MKKLVSLALAAALSLSSMVAFAAPNQYGIEPTAEVPVTLDTVIGTTSANLDSYETAGEALVVETRTDSATIQAKATIDMTDFATKWDEYVTAGASLAATNFGIDADVARAAVLSYAELTGEFKVVITVDKEVKKDYVSDAVVWSSNVTNLFSQEGMTFDAGAEQNVVTIIMEIAEDTTNEELDAYFMGVLANPQTASEEMSLTLNNVTVEGAFDVPYEIKTQFVGGVTIAVPSAEDMEVTFDETDTNFVSLKKKSTGGGGGPVATPKPTPTPVPTIVPTEPTETLAPGETEAPIPTVVPEIPVDNTPQIGGTASGAKLNYADHFAYIIGDDPAADGSVAVRPMDNITRAEVATIFYRLLEHESREMFRTEENHFSDVNESDWYNNAISTVVAAGIFEGYDDGTFGPNKAITRAEFAIISSRFSSLEYDGGPLFTDVVGHWAEDSINRAAVTGWINGYEDRSFRPDNKITRAEAITLINRVLYRIVHEDGHLDDGHIDFTDNDTSAWYYSAILEASNSHNYDREAIGHPEVHTELTDNIDWDSHEE